MKRAIVTLTFLGLVVLSGVAPGQTQPPRTTTPKPETPPIIFVKEYVRELIADEDLKSRGEKEFAEAKSMYQEFSTGIYVSKSIQLELRSQVAMLETMQLRDPFDKLIPTLIAFYQHEIELQQQFMGISSKFIAGPKPSVDYQALGAKIPDGFGKSPWPSPAV